MSLPDRAQTYVRKTLGDAAWPSWLLLGAVVFWWVGVVVPNLASVAFSERLPHVSLPAWTDPVNEASAANLSSSVALLAMALVALRAAVWPAASGWFARAGWVAVAAAGLVLAWDKVSDFHSNYLDGVGIVQAALGHDALAIAPASRWIVVAAPLILVFLLTMGLFLWRGIRVPGARLLLAIGLFAWILALAHDVNENVLFEHAATKLVAVLEETLEFSGSLLIGLSAAIVARAGRSPPPRLVVDPRGRLLIASIAVVIFGGLAVVFLFRTPLVEALSPYTRADTFDVHLRRHEALVQEVRMPAAPIHSLRLYLSNCGSGDRWGTVAVRVASPRDPSLTRSDGSVDIPPSDCPRWRDVRLLPPITAAQDQPLAFHVLADIEPPAVLGVGATKGNRYQDGRLWINGDLAWPDQNLEFVAYGAPEPTLSKLQSIGRLLSAGWRWPAIFVHLAVSLVLITWIPVLLVDYAFSYLRPRRWSANSQ